MTITTRVRPFRTRDHVSRARFAARAGGGVFAASQALRDPEREEIRRKGCRVLVVDDEDGFRTGLCAKLRRIYNADVSEAAGPQEALRMAATERHLQLILLDVSMPEMDGTEVCRQMRADGVTCRIVLMSAHTENRAHADALGVHFLSKPPQDRALRQVLLECGGDHQ